MADTDMLFIELMQSLQDFVGFIMFVIAYFFLGQLYYKPRKHGKHIFERTWHTNTQLGNLVK